MLFSLSFLSMRVDEWICVCVRVLNEYMYYSVCRKQKIYVRFLGQNRKDQRAYQTRIRRTQFSDVLFDVRLAFFPHFFSQTTSHNNKMQTNWNKIDIYRGQEYPTELALIQITSACISLALFLHFFFSLVS